MMKPFSVRVTPAFIAVVDGEGLTVLHVMRKLLNNDGDTVKEITDAEMFHRATIIAVGLNRLGKVMLG